LRPPAVDLRPIRILVVDDLEANLTAMQAVLSDCGYEVVEATSGEQALVLARDIHFAVILLDVQMPGLDGFETATRLRQLELSSATPIIFVTAIHRSDAYEAHGYIAGAVDFLFKPLNTAILQSKVAVFAELYRKTEQLRLAALREQENKLLKEALANRDEFLSVVSHELKTPITPLALQVQSFIQMLNEDRLASADPQRMLRMLTNSQNQINRLSRLVDDLIEVSRVKMGKLELSREEINLTDLVQNTLVSFEDELKRQGCEASLSAPGEVRGSWDPFRLEQVLINLLTNAAKYGAGREVELSLTESDGKAEISVRDHGIGINGTDQSRIFDRFERAVSSKNYGGLGIGLYLSRQIVELHGGRIWVESQPGMGSRFRVELPKALPLAH
jgi:signal transduction histidine kinase